MHLTFVLLLSILIQSTFLQPPGADATRIRLLLRDEFDNGIAGATLTLRTADAQMLDLTTDSNGVALSGPLAGEAVWLTGGRRSDGSPLVADSIPVEAGFRLALIAGQPRDALLRLDGDRIVLDPDMIFSPGEPGEPPPPTVAALAATVPPLTPASLPASGAQPTPVTPGAPSSASQPGAPAAAEVATSPALTILRWIGGGCLILLGLALLIGWARRRGR